jgi:hypothetical protein
MPGADLIVAEAHVKNGRLFILDRQRFDETVRAIDPRWPLTVRVERLKATRSQQANRYYWGVVVHYLSEHTGYGPDEMHDVLKALFIPKAMAILDGNGEVKGEVVLGGSTRQLKTEEFMDYIERIRVWAMDHLGVVIPLPNEAL